MNGTVSNQFNLHIGNRCVFINTVIRISNIIVVGTVIMAVVDISSVVRAVIDVMIAIVAGSARAYR